MADRITEAMVKRATQEFLSHKGDYPERILRGGYALWEANAEAMRAALTAALSREPGQQEWRSMESAPKDGTFIITRAGRWFRPAVVHWATYNGVTKWGGDPEGFMEEDHFLQYWTETRYEPVEWLPLEALDTFPASRKALEGKDG